MMGQKPAWRGSWYIYNTRTREFLKAMESSEKRHPDTPGGTCARWTPGIKHARAYKNPNLARKTANRINRDLYPNQNPKVATVITVVTGEAARCLDMINRRDTNDPTEIHGVRHRKA